MDGGSRARGRPFHDCRSARLGLGFSKLPDSKRSSVRLFWLCTQTPHTWPEVALLNKLVFENLRQRPVRTCLSVLAIGVQVTMILTLVGISYGTLDETARRARGVGADILVRPPASSIISLSSSPMSEKLVPFLMKQPHVTFATGTMGQPLGGFDVLTGIDLAQFNRLSNGFRWISGGPFETDDDVIVDEFYAREKKLSVGSIITLANHTWRVSGIFESGKLSHICAQLTVLQTLTGNPGRLSQIYLKVDDPTRVQLIVDQLRGIMMPGYFIYTMEEFTSLLTINSVGLLRDFIGVVIGIALVVGFIVVTMAMYTGRTRKNARDRNTEGAGGFVRLHSESGFSGDAADRDTRQHFRNCDDEWNQMADDACCSRQLDPRDRLQLVAYRFRHFRHRGFVGSHPPRVEGSEGGRYPGISLRIESAHSQPFLSRELRPIRVA